MDENDLIYIFVVKLDANNSASSDVTPAPTSGRNSSTTTGSAATGLTNGKKGNESLSKEMIDNVSRLNKTVSVVASTAVMSSIDALKTKRFDLEDQLDEFDDMDLSALSGREKKKYDRLKRRLEDVNEQIDELEEDMEGLKSAPKRLNYCNT